MSDVEKAGVGQAGVGRGQEEEEAAKARASVERWALLEQISDVLEKPMIVLSLVWLGVVLLDLFGYNHSLLDIANWVIWGIFVLHFLLEFVIAPKKVDYLQTNWLTAVSLFLPALRILRIARLARALRAARAARSLRLVRVVSTANRGLRTTRRILSRRGFTYVVLINLIVLLLGAGGMYAFEGSPSGIRDYGEALWWTAMTLTTLGASYEPQTLEGRILAYLLALFAFSVFGYITATLASVFVQQDRQEETATAAGGADALAGINEEAVPVASLLREEIAALREEVRSLRTALVAQGTVGPGPGQAAVTGDGSAQQQS